MIEKKILLTDCPDDKGLIAKITNIFNKHQLNILHNNEFVDFETKHFFMRTELEGIFNETTLLEDLKYSLPEGTNCRLIDGKRKRIVILVTKEAHCLGDILMKNYYGALNIEIAAVIGNHDNLRELVERFNIPFHLVSHEGLNRIEHDKLLAEHIDEYAPDYIVLAKYMRVLNPEFVERYPNRVINIHHSFLPAFIGAKPYQQAYERGVKIIGATAHFINNDVDHTYSADAMMRAGRDVEKTVLSRALDLALHDRIFVYKNKTVVL